MWLDGRRSRPAFPLNIVAIERKTKPDGDYSAPDSGGTQTEENEGETTTIPLSMLEGQSVNPGDVIRLKVISVDEQGGVVNVAYDHPMEDKEPQGSDELAGQMGPRGEMMNGPETM